jgi:hypothetical protein
MAHPALHSAEELRDPQQKRTPLPVRQLAILMFLRFTESASTFVIFPFLNEVCSQIHDLYIAEVGILAFGIIDRR